MSFHKAVNNDTEVINWTILKPIQKIAHAG